MLGQNLRQLWESLGAVGCVQLLEANLASGEFKPEDFSLRELAEAFCGYEWVARLSPRYTERYGHLNILEAGDGVDVSAFSNITGQIIYSKVHQGWDAVRAIGDELFETVPTVFDGERIPGIGRITGDGMPIRPGQDYPELGFGEQYWDTPTTTKHGFIVSVTKELVFFDRTSLALNRAGEAGSRSRYNKEKRQLACVAGITIVLGGNESFNGNNHKWNGTSYNTYATSANAIGINAKTSLPLVDYTSVETAELLWAALKDPDTALPINVQGDTIIVQPAKRYTAKRVLTATQIRENDGASRTMATYSASPLETQYRVLSSALLYQLIQDSGQTATNAADWWFLTQAKKAWKYMENWPLTVAQAPPNTEAEFQRDIIARWKVSERGIPWVADPRYTLFLKNA